MSLLADPLVDIYTSSTTSERGETPSVASPE